MTHASARDKAKMGRSTPGPAPRASPQRIPGAGNAWAGGSDGSPPRVYRMAAGEYTSPPPSFVQ